jgi:hypothetical protein
LHTSEVYTSGSYSKWLSTFHGNGGALGLGGGAMGGELKLGPPAAGLNAGEPKFDPAVLELAPGVPPDDTPLADIGVKLPLGVNG